MNDSVTKLPLAMRFYLIGLIYRNSRMSCVCLASLVEVSHDLLYRVLSLAFPYSRRLWEWFAAAAVKDGYLIIDDTVWNRFGKKLEGVAFVWDSSIGKKILGMNIILLIWTDGVRRIPIGLRIWQKGGKSKVKLAEELLWEVRRRGIIPVCVRFDAWYSAESLLTLLGQFGWFYCTRVKKNRLFNGLRIDKTFRHFYGRKQGRLKRINHARLSGQRRHEISVDQQFAFDFRPSEEDVSNPSAHRRSLSTVKARVRMGQMSGKFGAGTKGASASRIVCFLSDPN